MMMNEDSISHAMALILVFKELITLAVSVFASLR